MRRSVIYEAGATVFAIVGAFALVWPLRDGFNWGPFIVGLGILAVALWFNSKGQKLRKEGQ